MARPHLGTYRAAEKMRTGLIYQYGIIPKTYRHTERKQCTETMSIVGYHLSNRERGEEHMHVFPCLCTKKSSEKYI